MRVATFLFALVASVLPVLAAPTRNPEAVYEPTDDACARECAPRIPALGETEREALCSLDGLRSTLDCAQCIDQTWPDTTWEDSAMAEYDRIAIACEETPQTVLRHAGF